MRARHSLAAVALLAPLLASPVHAQERGKGGEADESRNNLRSYILRNETRKPITAVRLGSTNGGELYSEQKEIRPNEAMNVRVGRSECLRDVLVTFGDGSTARADNVNECTATIIRVQDGDKVVVTSSAQ